MNILSIRDYDHKTATCTHNLKKKKVLKYHRPGVSRKSVLNNQPSSYIKKNTKLYPTKLRIMLHIEANNKLWNN